MRLHFSIATPVLDGKGRYQEMESKIMLCSVCLMVEPGSKTEVIYL